MPTNIEKPHKISVIAAVGRNREIGFKNKLIWDIPEDLKHFRAITTGHPVIMGRNTYLSIGKALPNRTNIVLSDTSLEAPNVSVAKNLEEALGIAGDSPGSEEIFFIGGAYVYTQALPLADKLYLTLIDAEAEADTYFPDYSVFTKKIKEERIGTGDLSYSFIELER
ncbi:MAG: diacylglycerol kinase [Candidatus Zambryskibacteria bacterium RIFCSPHIGHO2_01_FULL_43_27]|uniref:Dihydrofolate reductase n=1 Tax=Candidatus Zambryskibacteria bacterium RIFCSPLOWO2_01_FULL_43_17 TaxID=1802760 RepID=A0A1G2U6B9_9BACT|nr:MAG: diacylglycerol kinase [Candidatus Zambryskibacteria bacterium RIFCSPHIGHO2_01_FULL_43_27]OHB00500.1 MAG: diacylglycerol kinase [Candidatus Zambryskibacteria bacterium RIFCSPHIGHO2_12_FULL_43_12b]OHB04550.1 MAG: diacylglycerol kinase [Candidatus Zambryskibacteria bacterium RIFCSPLOWO2_01_FULL_43_17]